jgi:hypothetical protein
MTFADRWGTEYPESARRHVIPFGAVDLTRGLKDTALSITKGARSTGDAILAIHAFVKNDLPSGKLPVLIQSPVMRASDILSGENVSKGMLSHNKVVVEVALMRSLDIPSRIGTYACDLSPAASVILAKNPRRVSNLIGWYPSLHHATEVYDPASGEFKVKDTSVSDTECKKLPGTCLSDDIADWKRTGEIKGLQKHARCFKVADHDDYPGILAAGIDVISSMRNSTHLFDIIDPED